MTRPAWPIDPVMPGHEQLEVMSPDEVLEGGDLDCGSGLVLLIREAMSRVPDGGVLEMRSHEPTVREDLPAWCRMVGHELLGELPAEGDGVRYFVRRGVGEAAAKERRALAEDRQKAKGYEWRVRVRPAGQLQGRVYCRNLSFDVGQPASFEEADTSPSAVEVLLGALGGALAVAFATACSQRGLEVDDIELTARGKLHNVLAHLGLEQGDPSFQSIQVRCFASTFDDEATVREAWQEAVDRSPIAATLRRAVELELKLVII